MKKLSYLELSILAAQELNRPASPMEIWDYIIEKQLYVHLKSYDEQIGLMSLGKTPWATVGATIYENAKKTNGQFQQLEGSKNPKHFFLKGLIEKQVNRQSESIKTTVNRFHERDLHPLLAKWLWINPAFNAHSRTIFHESSKKNQKGADKWLYPDMVAINFEYANYAENNVFNLIRKFDKLPIKIFSFELKIDLNFSNYKEYFFQAVSNSSWANEGYLVALNLSEDDEFIEALQKLSLSFGIGIIKLDAQNISQSKILSPARFKAQMDYSVVSELAGKNNIFSKFLKTTVEFDPENQSRYLNEFDRVLENDDFEQYLKAKKIIN
ncbi:MAG: hypothetical protein Q4A49_00665 [Neisseria sp.]|nr:hypothetical protein [Neisseria sp.]